MHYYVCEYCGDMTKKRDDMVPIQFGIPPHKHLVPDGMGGAMLAKEANAFYEYFEYCVRCATEIAIALKDRKKMLRDGSLNARTV